MENPNPIPTNRIEAFSDGVIAILITVMVFDLKLPSAEAPENILSTWLAMWPKFLSYLLSFVMLAIMWVNHHQLLHQVARADGRLIWLNMHLLFWMSLVPFATHFIGTYPTEPLASLAYGLVFFFNALAFNFLRLHKIRSPQLLKHEPQKSLRGKVNRNRISMAIFLAGAFGAFVWLPLSYLCFLIVPFLHLLPIKQD